MWAYVAYTNGEKTWKEFIKKKELTEIDGVKYKVNLEDGEYYEGIILAQAASEQKLKELVFEKRPRIMKNCFREFPTRVNNSMDNSNERRRRTFNNSDAKDVDVTQCPQVLSNQTGHLDSIQINEIEELRSRKSNGNETLPKMSNDDTLNNRSPSISDESDVSRGLINRLQYEDSDDDPTFKLTNQKQPKRKVFRGYLQTTRPSQEEESSEADSKSSVSDMDEDLSDDAPLSVPKIISMEESQGISKEAIGKSEEISTKQKTNSTIGNEEHEEMKKDNKIRKLEANDVASVKRYIQMSVTNVYSPVPYPKKLDNILKESDVGEAVNEYNSSIYSYVAAHATVVRSNADYTIFSCDRLPNNDGFYSGTNFEKLKFKGEMQNFKNEILSLLEENKQLLEKQTQNNNITSPDKMQKIQDVIQKILPVQSPKQFLKLNKLLKTSQLYRRVLKNMYKIILNGEADVKSCVKRVMGYIVASGIELGFSGTGRVYQGKKKPSYIKTYVFRIFKDVLLEKFGPSPDLGQLATMCGQWLYNNERLKKQ